MIFIYKYLKINYFKVYKTKSKKTIYNWHKKTILQSLGFAARDLELAIVFQSLAAFVRLR